MKLLFKKELQDKYTAKMYAANSVHEFDDERAKEILNSENGKKYVELVEPPVAPENIEKADAETTDNTKKARKSRKSVE